MTGAVHIGVDATASLSGEGYGVSVDAACSLDRDAQWKCPDAISFRSPMRKGDECQYKDGCQCLKLSAHLRAVTLLKDALEEKERELVAEMEAAW